MNPLLLAVFLALLTSVARAEAVSSQPVSSQAVSSQAVSPQLVATVAGTGVLVDEFVYIARKAIQARFYHGQIPEAELRSYQRELLDELVDSYLLAEEALRRGLAADMTKAAAAVQAFDDSASGQPGWVEARAVWLARIEAIEVRASLQALLEEQVRAAVDPSEAEVLAYYQKNLEKFVTPEQQDVSTILLKVEPSSTTEVWQQTEQQALALKLELEQGADFEELAEIHSGDASAIAGGAMGLMHRGLLGGEVEAVLEALVPGQIAEPLSLLDGVALLRLNARVESQQRTFEEVHVRARGLLTRELGELAWKALRFRLRSQADVVLNEELLQKMGV
ncbi:MAG: peptidylprolyl isomerase [Motiliproteus sp.]